MAYAWEDSFFSPERSRLLIPNHAVDLIYATFIKLELPVIPRISFLDTGGASWAHGSEHIELTVHHGCLQHIVLHECAHIINYSLWEQGHIPVMCGHSPMWLSIYIYLASEHVMNLCPLYEMTSSLDTTPLHYTPVSISREIIHQKLAGKSLG